MDWSPKSVHVPRGLEATVFEDCDFAGGDATFIEDVECIDHINWTDFLSKNTQKNKHHLNHKSKAKTV
jgi:hypothetical protein